MVQLVDQPMLLVDGQTLVSVDTPAEKLNEYLKGSPAKLPVKTGEGTMAWSILSAHNQGDEEQLRIKFDALASHDITYVGIIQTARASGLKEFPVPYVLTNCHNTLCAVGGTINEDDHLFGLSAAKRFGGIFVPTHMAVIHQYMREMHAGCGRMILGSDSHTRYGAFGTLGIGEGGPELVKQLLSRTYDIAKPPIVAVKLQGKPAPGVGPQDIALAIIKAVFANGFVKNSVLEFVGEGVANLSMDYRNGIDVMTTETTCLSSVWVTDDTVKNYLTVHGRGADYAPMAPAKVALYDKAIVVDMSAVPSMIALPFHPSNAVSIKEFNANSEDMLRAVEQEAKASAGVNLQLTGNRKDGRATVQQGVIAGCSGGTFENITLAAKILSGKATGNDQFALSVYPASQSVNLALVKNGAMQELMAAGATYRTAFCGPCFGAGDVPANNTLSIRHTTRNFINREGSKPKEGQMAAVALMDARSIAATAAMGGRLTGADELGLEEGKMDYAFDDSAYKSRIYNGYKSPVDEPLRFGPNIVDWPSFSALKENLVIEVASVIHDPVTTTDELIPSGETSSFRSNPERLSQFALSRRDPGYVERAKNVRAIAKETADDYIKSVAGLVNMDLTAENTSLASVVCAKRPGDGSAREQAASCQKVLGGGANIALEYATKRYRSNLVNWGMLPFIADEQTFNLFEVGDRVVVKDILSGLSALNEAFSAVLVKKDGTNMDIQLTLPKLQGDERDIIVDGCLINYYAAH